MSDKNPKKIKAASWLKYSVILALLMLAPITLINQIVLPVATV